MGDLPVLIPDLPEPLVAYRGFDVIGNCLSGFSRRWYPGVNVARHVHVSGFGLTLACRTCPSPPDAPPRSHLGHGCGFYGMTDLYAPFAQPMYGGWVLGRVLMWGTVYEHAHGFRASHSQIDAFYRVHIPYAHGMARWGKHLDPDRVDEFAAEFDVPVLPFHYDKRRISDAAQRSDW